MLRLPDGLEALGDGWFQESDVEKIIVSSSVKVLGKTAFGGSKKLREVVFEPDSHLESIGEMCFIGCGLKEIVIPKSVRAIGKWAF